MQVLVNPCDRSFLVKTCKFFRFKIFDLDYLRDEITTRVIKIVAAQTQPQRDVSPQLSLECVQGDQLHKALEQKVLLLMQRAQYLKHCIRIRTMLHV